MDEQQNSLSATNLAVYHHLNCDLYLHTVYHKHARVLSTTPDVPATPANQILVDSQYQRGIDWETTLYTWLDKSNLLLTVPPLPLEADVLLENILADDRDHFFITGLIFHPPRGLQDRFRAAGSEPVNFGISKPDLIEIVRSPEGFTWKVIDAKASKAIKPSHHVQIYFYTLCLELHLKHPLFKSSGEAGVWLPPDEGFNVASPSLDAIKSIKTALLSVSLDTFIFERLPKLLAPSREDVKWHFNPLCQGCKYNPTCRSRAMQEGRLGSMPNISISDARALQDLIDIADQASSRSQQPALTDIEELSHLLSSSQTLVNLEKRFPVVVKKGKRILGVRRKELSDRHSAMSSPILESVRSAKLRIIPRRNIACPISEDIAVIISIVQDLSSPKPQIEFFSVSLVDRSSPHTSRAYSGVGNTFITTLAVIIRNLTAENGTEIPTVQFYVWSASELSLIQTHLVKEALVGEVDRADVRLCIGALSQGASLLQTAFQPTLLSGALLSFLAKGRRVKAEYQACLDRMNLPTTGTVPELRNRVVEELQRLQGIGPRTHHDDREHEFGQVPRIVCLKREIESLLALPVAGYWDLQECVEVILQQGFEASGIPTNEIIFSAYKIGDDEALVDMLARRNSLIFAVLEATRKHVRNSGQNLLVNNGKKINTDFMDVCRQDQLRKLFFMQQFEVLAKLHELWNARMEGCPDAPVLEYQGTTSSLHGLEHSFAVVSGIVDIPSSDREMPFFDKLLVEDTTSDTEIPVEAMFDDLAISGLVVPFNRWTKPHWHSQPPKVQDSLLLADLRNAYATDGKTIVVMRTWGTTLRQILVPGRHYRLSSRLVDFNTTKILSSLFEMDLLWENREDPHLSQADTGPMSTQDHRGVPFLQLVMDPRSFGKVSMAKESLKIEAAIQRLFRNLKNLDVEAAGNLLLKPSQHQATQRLLANRLAVIWGPPGTGKTHTIALSILRLLEVRWKLGDRDQKIIFITAMTHAAIDACQSKLGRLIGAYQSIDSLPQEWLHDVRIERVMKGTEHPAPKRGDKNTHIYAGTLYQLYNFSKAHNIEVDCVIADEAGQIALASLSLVLRCLSPDGRVIIAGDSEQLAPIFTGSYPRLKTSALFGSVLDSVMFSQAGGPVLPYNPQSDLDEQAASSQSANTVIQLTENFRLNPDLGEFVATIYSHQFKPQKVQSRKLAVSLRGTQEMKDHGLECRVNPKLLKKVQIFFFGLSDVMFRRPQSVLSPPQHQMSAPNMDPMAVDLSHQPVSLSLIQLRTWTSGAEQVGYETHVHAEAALAAALIAAIQFCCPGDDIFVATPHRVQREAVKSALGRLKRPNSTDPKTLEQGLAQLDVNNSQLGIVTVDTVERLQGSEAAFVICLFSLPESHIADLGFLLGRRRLNVAISRAKTLCILVTSPQVLCPPVSVFANEEIAKGYAFLKAYEDRAWSYDVSLNVDDL